MEIYLKLFEVLFPVFFVVGIGYYLGKNNPKLDTSFITTFAANIGTPAMIIYSLTSTGMSFDIFKNYFWYYLIAIFIFTIVGIVFLFFLNTKDIIRELPLNSNNSVYQKLLLSAPCTTDPNFEPVSTSSRGPDDTNT